jgi:NAD(P)H-nitrite reductase large subunit
VRLTQRVSSVIGAGFIGLEVAAVARGLGREVTVVEALHQPLRPVGPVLGSVFAAVHREQGVRLLLDTEVTAVHGAGGVVEAVELADRQTIPAATVVVGIGVRPETDLAATAGVVVDDGSSSTSMGARACRGCLPPATSPAARMRIARAGCASSTGTTRFIRAQPSAGRWPAEH